MKYPPDSSDFEKRTYGEVKGLTDNSCCICLVSLPLPPRTEYACSDDSLSPPPLVFPLPSVPQKFPQEEYDDSSALTKLPCNHWMHSECIEKWFNRDVTCPLCKEVAIEKAYSDLLPIERVDLSGGSNSSSRNGSFSSRSTSRRPSLSRLIRDTLDQQAEVYFMYNNDQASNSGIMGFMRNLLQRERRQRSSRRGSRSSRRGSRSSQSGQESSVDEDVPPPDVEAAGGQGEEEEDSVDADQVDAVVRTDVENPAPRGE